MIYLVSFSLSIAFIQNKWGRRLGITNFKQAQKKMLTPTSTVETSINLYISMVNTRLTGQLSIFQAFKEFLQFRLYHC